MRSPDYSTNPEFNFNELIGGRTIERLADPQELATDRPTNWCVYGDPRDAEVLCRIAQDFRAEAVYTK